MKVTPISRSLKANALTNPNPSFVSIVKAGANQKPLRAVRMDAAVPVDTAKEAPMTTATTKTKLRSSTATVAAIAPQGYGVMQIEFAKTAFPDVSAVKTWMDAGGYSDYDVVETSKSFEIADQAEKFEPGSIKRIDGAADGVAVFVGKLADPTSQDGTGEASEVEPQGDGTPAGTEDALGTAKTAEEIAAEAEAVAKAAAAPEVPSPAPRTRAGAVPGEAPTEGAAAAIVDAIGGAGTDEGAAPPAPIADVQPGAEQTVEQKSAEIIQRGTELKTKGVYEAAALGSIVADLGWLVYEADYSGLSDDTISTIKGAALALLDAFMGAAQDAATALTGAFKSVEAKRAAEPAPEAPAAPALDAAAIADIVSKAVATAIAPIEDRARAAETVATEATARAATAEQTLAERVEADASRGQTRKGAEEVLETVSTDKTAKKSAPARTNILRSFGSRHGRKQPAAL